MPFGFCHEMIKGSVVTGARRAHGTRVHSARPASLSEPTPRKKELLLMETPLRDPSGELSAADARRRRALERISSALFSPLKTLERVVVLGQRRAAAAAAER